LILAPASRVARVCPAPRKGRAWSPGDYVKNLPQSIRLRKSLELTQSQSFAFWATKRRSLTTMNANAAGVIMPIEEAGGEAPNAQLLAMLYFWCTKRACHIYSLCVQRLRLSHLRGIAIYYTIRSRSVSSYSGHNRHEEQTAFHIRRE